MASSPLTDMLGKLNHVAIATPDIEKASQFYRNLGANVSEKVVRNALIHLILHSTVSYSPTVPHHFRSGATRARSVYSLRDSPQFEDRASLSSGREVSHPGIPR